MSIIKPFFNKTNNKTRGIGIFLVLLIMTIISCPNADSGSGSSSSSGGGSDDSDPPLVAVSVELIAGGSATGKDDKTGAEAKFNAPKGIAVDTDGNIYVADMENHSIRKVTPAGVVTTYAGLSGTTGTDDSEINNIPKARFTYPMDVLLKDADTFYVLDNKGIRKIAKDTASVSTFATRTAVGTGISNGFIKSIIRKPNTDIFYILNPDDADVNTNYGNRIIENPSGTTFNVIINFASTQSTIASKGTLDTAHHFSDAVFDSAGNMYVSTGHRGDSIITFNPSTADNRYAANHANFPNAIKEVAFFVGPTDSDTSGNTNGVGTAARFNGPRGMLIKGDYIYVADSNNHVIRMVQISTKTVSTLVGLMGTKGQQDGVKDVATFTFPQDIEFAPNGDIIVSENHAIRRIVVQK